MIRVVEGITVYTANKCVIWALLADKNTIHNWKTFTYATGYVVDEKRIEFWEGFKHYNTVVVTDNSPQIVHPYDVLVHCMHPFVALLISQPLYSTSPFHVQQLFVKMPELHHLLTLIIAT